MLGRRQSAEGSGHWAVGSHNGAVGRVKEAEPRD
jgi:hypothetical protein